LHRLFRNFSLGVKIRWRHTLALTWRVTLYYIAFKSMHLLC